MHEVKSQPTKLVGYDELAFTGGHGLAVTSLPPIRTDPFDRIPVAQSLVEGIVLLTADRLVAQYGGRCGRFDDRPHAAAPG